MTNFIKDKNSEMIAHFEIDTTDQTMDTLPPGFYEPKDIGGMFRKQLAVTPTKENDKLVQFKSGSVGSTLKLVGEFFSDKNKKVYSDMKLTHKMGIILHGPPGTGKTSTAFLIMTNLVSQHKAICLDFTGCKLDFIHWTLSILRKIQSSPIVAFIDEIDISIDRDEAGYLTFLDGSKSYEDLIVIGCTNDLADIPERIRNRRSRIKHVIEIKSFPIEVYEQYILDKIPNIDNDKLKAFSFLAVEAGLTLDEMKHCLIDHFIEGFSVEEAIKEAKKYQEV